MNKFLQALASVKNTMIAVTGGISGTFAFAPYNYSFCISDYCVYSELFLVSK